jgi:hypothetical protein
MSRRIFVCLALLSALLTGFASPVQASAGSNQTGLNGDTYVDPNYGFTVAWDGKTFAAEEITDTGGTPFGISLVGRGITASIAVGGYGDLQECVLDRFLRLERTEGVHGIHESRHLNPLEFGRDVTGTVYQYTYDDPRTGTSDTYATYFGCEPLLIRGDELPDVVLTNDFGTRLADFAKLSAEWIPLIDGITFSGERRTASPDHAGVNGNQYVDQANRWAVTWNASALTAENWVPAGSTSTLGVQLTSPTGNFMTIFIDDAKSLRTCVSAQIDQLEGTAFGSFTPVQDVNVPKTGTSARAALYQGVFASQAGERSSIYLYVECRPLVVAGQEADRRFLVATLISDVSTFASDLPAWSDVLRSVRFDAAGATGISGDTHTSSTGYQLAWDDSVYVADYLDAANPDFGISLSSRDAILNVQVAGDATARACVSTEADIVAGLDGMGKLRRSRVRGPEPGAGSASQMYDSTVTFKNGNEAAAVVYIECRPLGEVSGAPLFVVIRMVGIKSSYRDELPRWQDILDSVTVSRPAGQD